MRNKLTNIKKALKSLRALRAEQHKKIKAVGSFSYWNAMI